jgi:dCMP deaminase
MNENEPNRVRTGTDQDGARTAADTPTGSSPHETGTAGSRGARPSWDDYFLEIADTVSNRATCDRGRSGCVIVKDKRILVTGYVGSPSGLPHCDEAGHQLKRVVHEDGTVTRHCVRTVHAEQNALCQAARFGIPVAGATLYCRMTPCRTCAMLIINAGITRVVCERKYHAGSESEALFREAGVELGFKSNEVERYERQAE